MIGTYLQDPVGARPRSLLPRKVPYQVHGALPALEAALVEASPDVRIPQSRQCVLPRRLLPAVHAGVEPVLRHELHADIVELPPRYTDRGGNAESRVGYVLRECADQVFECVASRGRLRRHWRCSWPDWRIAAALALALAGAIAAAAAAEVEPERHGCLAGSLRAPPHLPPPAAAPPRPCRQAPVCRVTQPPANNKFNVSPRSHAGRNPAPGNNTAMSGNIRGWVLWLRFSSSSPSPAIHCRRTRADETGCAAASAIWRYVPIAAAISAAAAIIGASFLGGWRADGWWTV